MLRYWRVLIAAVVLILASVAVANPNGSPTCDATVDKLHKMSDPKNNPTSDAFSIDVKKKGDKYEIRFIAKNLNKSKYTGFLLYVEDSDGKRIGKWKPANYLKNVANDQCNDGTTITQVNTEPKNKDSIFTWIPPSKFDGNGVVKGSLVVSMNEWYVMQKKL